MLSMENANMPMFGAKNTVNFNKMDHQLEKLGQGADAVTLIVDGVRVKCGFDFKVPSRETAKELVICTEFEHMPR